MHLLDVYPFVRARAKFAAVTIRLPFGLALSLAVARRGAP